MIWLYVLVYFWIAYLVTRWLDSMDVWDGEPLTSLFWPISLVICAALAVIVVLFLPVSYVADKLWRTP
jgi:hypothetical protein